MWSFFKHLLQQVFTFFVTSSQMWKSVPCISFGWTCHTSRFFPSHCALFECLFHPCTPPLIAVCFLPSHLRWWQSGHWQGLREGPSGQQPLKRNETTWLWGLHFKTTLIMCDTADLSHACIHVHCCCDYQKISRFRKWHTSKRWHPLFQRNHKLVLSFFRSEYLQFFVEKLIACNHTSSFATVVGSHEDLQGSWIGHTCQ